MSKFTKRSLLLFFAGTMCMSLTFVFQHFFQVGDFVRGICTGVGLGLLLLSLLLSSK